MPRTEKCLVRKEADIQTMKQLSQYHSCYVDRITQVSVLDSVIVTEIQKLHIYCAVGTSSENIYFLLY